MIENEKSDWRAKLGEFFSLIGLLSILGPIVFGAQDASAGLPPQYKKWLEEEVVYIISPLEKKVLLALQTDRERDVFINAFWRQRNPGPLADRNEFKDEHYRRIAYANKEFGRTSSVPGWKTDRGKAYIRLGQPLSIERSDNVSSVFPTEVWNYQGMSKYRLPDMFHLIFFRKFGSGDYRLYSPSVDGPQSLLATGFAEIADVQTAYEELRRQNPRLAEQSLSLIPGDILYNGLPSASSESLLLSLPSAPLALLKDEYAEKFLSFKGIVEVEYSTNFIGNESLIQVIRDETGISYVNYLVELDSFSVEPARDKYVTRILLNGKVTDPEGKAIYQFEKAIPLEFNQEQLDQIRVQKCSLQDLFPLIAGSYQFSLLVKNEASKEFTSVDQKLVIPSGDTIGMNRMLLAYKKEDVGQFNKARAFLVKGVQYFPSPRQDFTTQDTLVVFFQLFGLTEDFRKRGACTVTLYRGEKPLLVRTIPLDASAQADSFVQEFALSGFAPDYYRARVSLLDPARNEILHDEKDFFVTHAASLPRSWISSIVGAAHADPVYLSILGSQLLNKGEPEKAALLLEKAYRLNTTSPQAALGYGQALFLLKAYPSVVELLAPFAAKQNPDVLELLGRSFHALGDFQRAISYYQAYLSHFGTNFAIYALMGDCHLQLGQTAEALKAWEKSLEINPDQEELKKRIDALKKKSNGPFEERGR
jgi:GWxTD domain-containing protein